MEYEWRLCNTSYHQIVKVMTESARNLSLLRGKALEWYHISIIEKVEDKENEMNTKKVGNKDCYVKLSNDEVTKDRNDAQNKERKSDEWIQPKKVCHRGNVNVRRRGDE